MGVKFSTILEDYGTEITFKNVLGKKVVIDAYNVIYQFLATIRGVDGNPLQDSHGNKTSHLKGLFNRTIKFIENDIKPIYVFDGKPNPLKQAEIDRRKQAKAVAQHQLNEAVDDQNDSDIKKYAGRTSHLNSNMIEDAKTLLKLMGIPIYEAVHDGEAQASYMVSKGSAHAIGTQDYDAFLFGAPKIIRNFSVTQTRTQGGVKTEVPIKLYDTKQILEEGLEITKEQLVDIGILIGVDFFEGISGIGGKKALDIVKSYGSIEEFLESKASDSMVGKKMEKFDFSALTPEFISEVRDIFLLPELNTDYAPPRFESVDKKGVIDFLCKERDFSQRLVESGLKRLAKKQPTKTQFNLDNFTK